MAKIYSHSRINTFEQCPLKFKLKYIDKIKPAIEQTIETHLGGAVHETLEWLYGQVIRKIIPTIENMITFYAVKWQDSYSDDTLFVKKELSQKDYFNKGVEFLTNYYTQHYPFKDNTLEVEKKILVDIDDKGEYKITGFIDRLTFNLATGEYEIHDYKTANSLPHREKFEKDKQLALYAIAIKETFGQDKKVCLIWHYLAHNQKICVRKTDEELHNLKKDTYQKIKEIESTEKFDSKKSVLCSWCEYKEYCYEFGGKNLKEESEIEVDISD